MLTGRDCNCGDNSDIWVEDEGYLEDIRRFPIKTLVFGDTDEDDEEMYYTLGPLKCTLGTDEIVLTSWLILYVLIFSEGT